MSRKHWLAAYGEKTPCEINPDAHGSVLAMLEAAIQRFADRPALRRFGHTAIKQVISVAPGEGIGAALPAAPIDARPQNVITFAAALTQGGALPFTPVALCGDDLLFLQYTGGTTGLSKGAALSHRNLVANTEQFKAFMGDAMRPGEDVVVTALPLYHIFALMLNFISYYSIGAENWLIANPRAMDGFVDILRQARPTALTGVNTLYAGLLMHPKIREV